jgi:hypothetical protein
MLLNWSQIGSMKTKLSFSFKLDSGIQKSFTCTCAQACEHKWELVGACVLAKVPASPPGFFKINCSEIIKLLIYYDNLHIYFPSFNVQFQWYQENHLNAKLSPFKNILQCIYSATSIYDFLWKQWISTQNWGDGKS